MRQRLLMTGAIAVVAVAAFATGSGRGSAAPVRGAQRIPAGLVAAIHARLGAGAIRSSAAPNLLADPLLGLSVSVSADGTTALVGAIGVHGGQGAAYIFHAADAGSWTSSSVPTATLSGKASPRPGLFGYAVALSADGTTAFVGSPFGGVNESGAVYVFHASSEDAWMSSSTAQATLRPSHGYFAGFALALSNDGTTVVVGAPDYSLASGSGGAYVFHAASESAWTSTSTPAAFLTTTASGDATQAGLSVAISADGTTALLSAASPSPAGAYVFHVSAADAWATSSTPTAILTDGNGGSDTSCGRYVALSADGTLALLGGTCANSNAGAVAVFHSSGEAAWTSTSTPAATLLPPGGGSADSYFGTTVAVSSDGTTAITTAAGTARRGVAYVYRAAGEGAWTSTSTPAATLSNSAGRANDTLAIAALAADGATAFVGAPGVDKWTGAADVFHVADATDWTTSSAPTAILTDKALAACVVPKLKGLKLSAAKYALVAGRCRVGKVTKVHAKHKKHGRVLSQSKKAGRRLAIGARVNVKIGK